MNNLILIYFFIFGLLIGSFLNVIIVRLPLKKDIVVKRSSCPHCHALIKWFQNIPLLSFVFLRGKCAQCSASISWKYPLVEVLVGLISLLLAPENITLMSMTNYFFYFLVSCIFVCHFFIDLEHHLLLDSLNLMLLSLMLSYSFVHFQFSHWIFGGLIGFFIPLAVTWVFYKIKGQIGLGGGDIKLYGILGIFLGPFDVLFNIFLSCFVGAFIGVILIFAGKMTKDKPMAFGPAILLVASLQIYFPKISTWIQTLIF